MNQTERTVKSKKLAELLDSRFQLPGTDIRFGIDPILGLLLGLGDWIGGVLTLYFPVYAVVAGARPSILWRMFLNIIADIIIGTVPLIGEIFDVAWKANLRNARLLEELEQNPDQLATESKWILWLLLIVLLLQFWAF